MFKQWRLIRSVTPSLNSRLAFSTPRLALLLPLGLLLLRFFAGSSSSSRTPNGGVPRDSILRPPPFSSCAHPSRLLISVQVKIPTFLSWVIGSTQPVRFPSLLCCLSSHSPPAQLISLLILENAKITLPSSLFTYCPLCLEAHYLTSFRSLFKCPHFREILPNTLYNLAAPHLISLHFLFLICVHGTQHHSMHYIFICALALSSFRMSASCGQGSSFMHSSISRILNGVWHKVGSQSIFLDECIH